MCGCLSLFLTCNCLKYSGKKKKYSIPFLFLIQNLKGGWFWSFFCQKRLGYGFALEGLLRRAEINIVMTGFSSKCDKLGFYLVITKLLRMYCISYQGGLFIEDKIITHSA